MQWLKLEGRSLAHISIHQQAIHPTQIDIIQSTFVPTPKGEDSLVTQSLIITDISSPEILRAAKILHQMEVAHSSQKGAVGLEGEMIDAPMLRQVLLFASSQFIHLLNRYIGRNYNTSSEDGRVNDSRC